LPLCGEREPADGPSVFRRPRATVVNVAGREVPTYEDVVTALVNEFVGTGLDIEEARRRAEEFGRTAGIRNLVQSLAVAERVLRAGEGFHSIERFFVDDSEEQRYLIHLHNRS
jgi:hypothetical protein